MIIGAVFLLFATICIFLMGVHSFPRRHFYLTPSIAFIGVLLLFFALVFYANRSIINGVSVRLVIAAIVLGFTSFSIVAFVAGRYSVFYQRNPTDFQYSKTGNTETIKQVEEQQTMNTENN
jgi:ABC-type Fe3+-siderophore transport system permease subunit